MRPRIRCIKPEVFHDERLWALSVQTGMPVLQGFAGLWCYADREGRFEWRPAALKSLILPYWNGDFAALLDALALERFIVRYEVAGRSYGFVRKFKEHQKINAREPASALPVPPSESHRSAPHVQSDAPHSDAPGEGKGSGMGMGREWEGARAEPEPPSRPTVTEIRTITGGGVARTYSLPGPDAPEEYLAAAVMGGVSLEQAKSTWKHYHGAGLPPQGIERPYAWLVQRASERAVSQARAGPSKRGQPDPPKGIPVAEALKNFR